jgi:hypothetical protein
MVRLTARRAGRSGSRTRSRTLRGAGITIASLAAACAVQMVGAVPAFANAANPKPDTSGTATVNGDGTVTAELHGTWIFPGQACAGRWGTGYAVDWWGISGSKTPSPSFSLTNATAVVTPGSTTTTTISPAGAIQLKNVAPAQFFHVGQYLAGETIHSASTCTDVMVNGKTAATGSWAASATYPSLSDIPANVCVNMYDQHGSEGKISTNSKDFSPLNSDNSIQTNAFNPSSGMGYCVALKVVTQKIQSEIYLCNNGVPTTTLLSGGTITVPSASLSSANPLAPTNVSAGTYTVNATVPSGNTFVACGQPGVTINTSTSASQSVTVPSGGTGDGKFYVSVAPPPPGYLEICKKSGPGISGSFTFQVAGKTVTVPAGACSSAFQVPSGHQLVHEVAQSGYAMVHNDTYPSSRWVSSDLKHGNVTVNVVAGDSTKQTILTVTNQRLTAALKICQVAGSGVAEGTNFPFTTSATSGTTNVPAGPAPGGTCVVVGTNFYQNSTVTITQQIPSGDRVTSITVATPDRQVGSADLANGKVTVKIGSGVTEVTYTDASSSS